MYGKKMQQTYAGGVMLVDSPAVGKTSALGAIAT